MLKKSAIKKGKVIKVTFYTHKTKGAQKSFLVGDFNDWNESDHPMDKLKDGRFKTAMELDPGQSYHFRYMIDGEWHNEWEADSYAPNPFSGDNSVLFT